MKILNLYSGLGGNRTLWNDHEITAIEFNSVIAKIYQKRFPSDKVLVQDVFAFLQDTKLDEYDFIWASPPCQTHSHMQLFTKKDRLPKLQETLGLLLWLNRAFKKPFVIENVVPWYGILKVKFQNLHTVIIDRHLFYSNFIIPGRLQQKGKNRHGKIGGIMRETREELLKKYFLRTWIIDDLKGVHDKDQIIRNCVDPKLGKYILDQVQKPELLNYLGTL